jgi:hypothetical protein
VTTLDARKFIDRLRLYFMQEGNEGSPLSALDVCADFVHSQSLKRTHQGTMDKFFRQWPLGTKSWKVRMCMLVI